MEKKKHTEEINVLELAEACSYLRELIVTLVIDTVRPGCLCRLYSPGPGKRAQLSCLDLSASRLSSSTAADRIWASRLSCRWRSMKPRIRATHNSSTSCEIQFTCPWVVELPFGMKRARRATLLRRQVFRRRRKYGARAAQIAACSPSLGGQKVYSSNSCEPPILTLFSLPPRIQL